MKRIFDTGLIVSNDWFFFLPSMSLFFFSVCTVPKGKGRARGIVVEASGLAPASSVGPLGLRFSAGPLPSLGRARLTTGLAFCEPSMVNRAQRVPDKEPTTSSITSHLVSSRLNVMGGEERGVSEKCY